MLEGPPVEIGRERLFVECPGVLGFSDERLRVCEYEGDPCSWPFADCCLYLSYSCSGGVEVIDMSGSVG